MKLEEFIGAVATGVRLAVLTYLVDNGPSTIDEVAEGIGRHRQPVHVALLALRRLGALDARKTDRVLYEGARGKGQSPNGRKKNLHFATPAMAEWVFHTRRAHRLVAEGGGK